MVESSPSDEFTRVKEERDLLFGEVIAYKMEKENFDKTLL